jgi:hypothetical protein
VTAEILKPFGEFGVPGPNQGVIEELEAALAQARMGDIIGVAIAMVHPNGDCGCLVDKSGCRWSELLGAVDMMKDDIKDKWRRTDG